MRLKKTDWTFCDKVKYIPLSPENLGRKKERNRIKMENKNQTTKPNDPARENGQPSLSAQEITKGGMEVIKREGKYPIYAIIMCGGAAIGHLIGTYVFDDLMTCTALGMGAGILAAFIYSRKRKDKENLS